MIEIKKKHSEKAISVGSYGNDEDMEPDDLLDELDSLITAAGGKAVGRSVQRRMGAGDKGVVPATYIGLGKANQIGDLAEALEADVIVFDNELSPAQVRELEKIIKRRVIDRSELILDIFASRAKTKEARLQVELAQLQYTAPRLRGMWTHLERQGGAGGTGGMGTRGPGEKQIEIDRRIVSDRLVKLRRELAGIHGRKQREVNARTNKHFCVGLVGYTNAGKSTLMNHTTNAGTYQADKLFATLDTKTRKWDVGQGVSVMLSDTVGFVRNLPHQLVASFRATLEEALTADLLLHVVDAAHPQALEQIETVQEVLRELNVEQYRVLAVLNKQDLVEDEDSILEMRARLPDVVSISAHTGVGMDDLANGVLRKFREYCAEIDVKAPLASGKMQAYARQHGLIESENYDESSWQAKVYLPKHFLGEFKTTCQNAELNVF